MRVVLVQFIVGCAFAVRVIKSGFDELDPRYEQLAMSLGATPFQAFYKVQLPNVVPALVAGAVISWARIFGLFGKYVKAFEQGNTGAHHGCQLTCEYD